MSSRRRRKTGGLWSRKYVVAVVALLLLGTLSTLALTYMQTELREPWGAQYTLTYTGASIELSNPHTTVVGKNTLYVEFDVTPSDKEVRCRFTVTPLDSNQDPLDAAGDTRTTTVTWYPTGGGNPISDFKKVDAGLPMQTVHNMPSAQRINKIRIKWTNDNFLSEYEGVKILIEDIE